jgi:serine/threonine protein kinase/Tol biopolymer transport system component
MDDPKQSAEELFAEALDLPPEKRTAFLDRACRDAPDLRVAIEDFLRDNDRIGSFLDRPLLAPVAPPGSADTGPSPSISRPLALGNRSLPPRFHPADVIANRFEVVRFIARGGMGEVYEVKDQFLQGVNLALKTIRPETASDAGSASRFEQEVILARRVTHPNLCPIYDIFRCEQPAPSFSFLTMKLLRGETLDDSLKQSGNLPAGQALEICRQLLRGVAALHDGGIIHRDLKPNNVMLEKTGERLLLSIMDFGLARPHELQSATGISITIAGTLGYMAPELLRGQPPSKASDIFALGIVIHQVLTGERPAENRADSSMVPLPTLRSAHNPAHFVQAVRGFLSVEPEKRVRAFEQLRLVENGQGPGPYSPLSSRSSKAIWFTAAVALVFGAAWLAARFTSPPVPHPLASRQITFSTEPKDRPLLSDGSRLYFQKRGIPAEMVSTGGIIAPLPGFEPGMVIRAVSPDGAKVIAVKPDGGNTAGHGPLWMASSLGGVPRRLGSVVAQDIQWSRDGRSLVFADKGAVYTSDGDGNNEKKIWEAPGDVDSLGFSPDGRKLTLAVITKQNSLLWRMNVDGTGAHPVQLDWPADSQEWYGQWTPNAKHFVFLSNREGAANVYELVMPRWFEFWKKPAASLITGNQIGMLGLAPGRDGESLYVLAQVEQGAMHVLDSHSGKFEPFLDGFPAIWFVISPDRQWMAYTDYPGGSLWKSRLDGSEPLQLSTNQGYMQAWSKDSKSLVYTDGQKLYLVSADGGTPKKLIATGTGEGMPSWAPDGKSVTFGYVNGEFQPVEGIYDVDLASGRVSMMAGSTSLSTPSWSPDGKYLLAFAKEPSRMMLYSAKTKAWKELRKLISPPFGFWVWSRDSQSIYIRPEEGGNEIFRLSVPSGKWERVSGMEGIHLGEGDGFLSLTADGRIAIMSHTAVAQIYSLQWRP